jgi:hypothetical protein
MEGYMPGPPAPGLTVAVHSDKSLQYRLHFVDAHVGVLNYPPIEHRGRHVSAAPGILQLPQTEKHCSFPGIQAIPHIG